VSSRTAQQQETAAVEEIDATGVVNQGA
jgi:hypothetical protein